MCMKKIMRLSSNRKVGKWTNARASQNRLSPLAGFSSFFALPRRSIASKAARNTYDRSPRQQKGVPLSPRRPRAAVRLRIRGNNLDKLGMRPSRYDGSIRRNGLRGNRQFALGEISWIFHLPLRMVGMISPVRHPEAVNTPSACPPSNSSCSLPRAWVGHHGEHVGVPTWVSPFSQ